MSKSRNDFHPTGHRKNNRYPRYILGIDKDGNLKWRNRKIKPYGLKGWCGYGGEQYLRKYGEIMTDIVDKKSERRNAKRYIREELYLYEIENEKEISDKELLEMIAKRISNSKSMPNEFSKIIDEDFWDLV